MGEGSGGVKTQFFGDIRVDAIQEFDFSYAVDWLFPNGTREDVAEQEHWLGPSLVEPGTLALKVRMHMYLIRTRHHTILFDTCCGNDKERPDFPEWHHLRTPFLENLARGGVLPEQVDFVMCSHMHADHINWNTRLENGEWVPTFPKARYLMSKGEFETWREDIASGLAKPHRKQPWVDSILPVVDRGLATFVDDDHVIENKLPDEVRYMPLHGHTKHHCGLYLRSGSKDAIFSGDAIHHPIQLVRPDLINASYDRETAKQHS